MPLIQIFFFILVYICGFSQTVKWKIIWDKNPEKDIKEYVVYKNNEEKARVKSPDTFYVDRDIDPGILYSYKIMAVNEKNIPSLFSEPVKAAVPGFKDLPTILGITKNKPIKLYLKKYINDPDDSTHEIKRINIPSDSRISVSLESSNLIFTAKNNWTEQDSEYVDINVKDPHNFYNEARIVIKDESLVGGNFILSPQDIDIKISPSEFSLSRYSSITFSNIPKGCKIGIFDSFGTLVYSEKDVSDVFSWDADDNNGNQVLFGMYRFKLFNRINQPIFESSFRVIP